MPSFIKNCSSSSENPVLIHASRAAMKLLTCNLNTKAVLKSVFRFHFNDFILRVENSTFGAKNLKNHRRRNMQISTKFTIAVHILAATEFFSSEEKVTSELLSESIGSNPVIIRNIMSDLKNAGLIETKRGPGGITIEKPLDQISFYDVYEAVEKNKERLFNFHENPNPACPVGKNIHAALDNELEKAQSDFENGLKNCKISDVVQKIHEQAAKEQ